jgi:hypothetical protein
LQRTLFGIGSIRPSIDHLISTWTFSTLPEIWTEATYVAQTKIQNGSPFVNPPFFNVDRFIASSDEYQGWQRYLDEYKDRPITEIEKKIVLLTSVCDSVVVDFDGSGDQDESDALFRSVVGYGCSASIYTPSDSGIYKMGGILI